MANVDTRSRFKTRWYHRRPNFWFRRDRPRPAGHRPAPEIVRFEPTPGAPRSDKPPVRIFLGTEPLQARAERVFLWSVNVFRDLSRVYEVHLMKDLAGFDRSGWTTGFTNYRYAIPALAGGAGRAIYNDVDQVYLADPAELFDLAMGGAKLLCVDKGETSVALMDCAAMSPHWRIEDAKRPLKRGHFLAEMTGNALWGPLDGAWNARDDEYVPEHSKCLHFTTLNMQPWRPFPDQLRYFDHPHGAVWLDLEAQADAARFNAFTRARPSAGFAATLARPLAGPGARRDHDRAIAALVEAHGVRSVLDGAAQPGRAPFQNPVSGEHDGVVSIGELGRLPEDDVPWALDELFAAARRFVYVATECDAAGDATGTAAALPAEWWRLQVSLAEARTPGRDARLALSTPGGRTAAIPTGAPRSARESATAQAAGTQL